MLEDSYRRRRIKNAKKPKKRTPPCFAPSFIDGRRQEPSLQDLCVGSRDWITYKYPVGFRDSKQTGKSSVEGNFQPQ
jgi:hypothetical protein